MTGPLVGAASTDGMARLLVIGSINMDTLLQTEKPPTTDGAVRVMGWRQTPGGHAANCATTLAALGAAVGMIGAVGDDEHGRVLIANLAEQGVDVEGIQRLDNHSTGEVIIPTRGTDHFMFVLRGANDYGSCDIAASIARFQPEGLVVFDPSDGLFQQINTLRRIGGCALPIYWIPGGINAGDPNFAFMLEISDVVIVNETEHRALFAHASPDFFADRRRELITTRGSQGARLQCGTLDIFVSAAQACVTDSIGAGDTFAAAYILARRRDLSPERRLSLANAAGAIAVGSSGARAPVQKLADLWQASHAVVSSDAVAVSRHQRESNPNG